MKMADFLKCSKFQYSCKVFFAKSAVSEAPIFHQTLKLAILEGAYFGLLSKVSKVQSAPKKQGLPFFAKITCFQKRGATHLSK